MDSRLARVKALIWVHSVIGAGLVIAFFFMVCKDLAWSVPIVGCGIAWFLVLGWIERRAAELGPSDRIPARGLPGWALALFAVGQIGGLVVRGIPHPEWLVIGHLFVGGTILCRGGMSVLLDVPIHGRTWNTCMLLLGLGLVRHLLGVVVERVIRSC
jgi:hypothetical protein